MKATARQQNDFLAHKLVPGVAFAHNSFMLVVGGEHKGHSGSLISIEGIGTDPVYLVELESGDDVLVQQSCLRVEEA